MRRGAVWPLAAGVAVTLLALLVAISPVAAQGQRGGGHGAAPRFARPAERADSQRSQGDRAERQRQQQREFQRRQRFQNQYSRPQPAMGGYGRQQQYDRGQQQNFGRQPYARPGYQGAPGNVRPALPANRPYSYAYPPGHLGSWLHQHQNVPLQGQEQLLRDDPSFRRLPQGDQQRLMRQLQQVDRMPQQERERRLARAEMIEHMSPQQRMQLNQSSRQLQALPADRQQLVKRAFQDLSSVPLDQRQTVLNSQRYQQMFSPQERNILGNLLQAEPYEPAR